MKTQAKRDFDARALENGYDHIYKNETQRWRHQLNKAQKNASPVQLEKMKEFADWIFSQAL